MEEQNRNTSKLSINEMDTEKVESIRRGVSYFTKNIEQVSSLQAKAIRCARLCQDFTDFMINHPMVRAFITIEGNAIEIDDIKPHAHYFDWLNVRQKGTLEYFMVPAYTAFVLNFYMDILG
jgi:hypothetical protein